VAIHPVGRQIQDHKSTQEVLEAFHDITKALRSLYMDAKILHRDVSPGNIMISTTKQEGTPRGFLVDLDVAICLEKESPKEGTRYDTRAFMAIGVLLAKEHTCKRDLESLFYSSLWTAICGKGKAWPPHESKLWGWLQGSFQECAAKKSREMQAEGFEGVLDDFTQEFVDCKELARELWRIFFPNGDEDDNNPEVCYQAVLKAFRNAGAEARSFCSSGTW
jgi:serine/threonine protein kinase